MVYAREHDDDDAPWVGHPRGGGWPIFLEAAAVPNFGALRRQPRTAVQHFLAVEERARHHMKKWRSLLGATAGLSGVGGGEAHTRRRYARGIRWWADFLADHKARWPLDDTPSAALLVDECGGGLEEDLLPMPHTVVPGNLGPIIQRYVLGVHHPATWLVILGIPTCVPSGP